MDIHPDMLDEMAERYAAETHTLRDNASNVTSLPELRRDLFAAFAMAGFLSQRWDEEKQDRTFTMIAQMSYRMARAMETAREVEKAMDNGK